MGLFSKKPKEPARPGGQPRQRSRLRRPKDDKKNKKQSDAERVQAELDAMKERLVAAERSKADLEARLRVLDDFNASLNSKILILDEANAHLDGRLDAIDQGVTMLGGQLDTLTASNDRLTRRLLAVDDLDARLGELTDRLEHQKSTTPTPPPPIARRRRPPSFRRRPLPRHRPSLPRHRTATTDASTTCPPGSSCWLRRSPRTPNRWPPPRFA